MPTIDNVRFELTIDSGNQAIVDYPDLAVKTILYSAIAQLNIGKDYGVCKDENGNRVGEWCLTIEESE